VWKYCYLPDVRVNATMVSNPYARMQQGWHLSRYGGQRWWEIGFTDVDERRGNQAPKTAGQ